MTEAGELEAFLEALLFVADRPMSTAEIASLAGVPSLHAEAALAALDEQLLSDRRGLRVQRHDDAWQLVTAPEVGDRLLAYAARDEPRLSPAALEALAVVAYHQPCTRADVERLRGVDSDFVLRNLVHRRLIAEVGRRDTPGRPIVYGTTFTFLERFGLRSVDELPVIDLPRETVAVAIEADISAPSPTRGE